jgi:hypothetical protein
MDERRFDELTKALVGAKPSRREALRRLAGSALATVFGSVVLEGASAQRVGIAAKTCGQVCTADGDCNFGLRCGAGSDECVAILPSKDPCDNNGDCDLRYETCNNNNGKCVNTVANCDQCFENDDCEGAGTKCIDGKCVVPDCTDNSDCGKNKKCRKGECVRKN